MPLPAGADATHRTGTRQVDSGSFRVPTRGAARHASSPVPDLAPAWLGRIQPEPVGLRSVSVPDLVGPGYAPLLSPARMRNPLRCCTGISTVAARHPRLSTEHAR